MESTDSLHERLEKISRELEGYKIELHQTRNFLQSILQNSNDMIFATDVDGVVISFSKGGEELLGYSWKELAGRSITDIAQYPSHLDDLLRTSRQEGNITGMEFPFLHKEGHPLYFNISLINLTNAKGQSVGTVGVCRDITRWKTLQEDLVRVDRLAEIGRLSAAIAHEINNPLAVITEASGWGSTVLKGTEGLHQEDRTELKKAFEDIADQAQRCKVITQELLGFARDSEPARKECDLHEIIKKTVSFVQPELKFKPIQVVCQFPEDSLILESDPKMLEQVFVNLVTNAIHAIKEKGTGEGTVEITTTLSEAGVEIKVSDTGTGMSDEVRNRIFDLFFTTKPRGKGTGMGLPISHNIIKKLGGEITCESRLGEGTTFHIRIPLL